MKRIISLILALLLILAMPCAALAFNVDTKAAILIDAATGRIIYQQNAHEKLAPASTTKVLTCLLTLENIEDLSQTVTLPDDFVNVGESGIYLEAGDTLTFEELLYALMLRSANDAAQALAIGVSGTEEAFTGLMNQRTMELGLLDSHWDNAYGLDTPTHLTSAYDLAMITKEAMHLEMFNTLIQAPSYSITSDTGNYDRILYNHNQLLDLYDGADGVKTGYTSVAGSCLIGSATRDGLRLIGVVLDAEDHYAAMETLLDYGFALYEGLQYAKAGDIVGSIRVLNAKINRVDVVLGEDVVIPVSSGSDYQPTPSYDFPVVLEAPFAADEIIGYATYADDLGNTIKVPLYPSKGAEHYSFVSVFRQAWQSFLGVFLRN